MAKKKPYQIGYGKPPRETQFTKGQSGNPKGRPKGSKNLSTIVLRESRQRVQINGPNGSRIVTKLEASMMQLSNKAAQGDLRASRELFALIQLAETSLSTGLNSETFHEADQRVLGRLRRRLEDFAGHLPAKPSTDSEEDS